VPTEDLEGEGDGTEGADQEERPPDGPALVLGKAVPQQQAEASAQRGTGAGDQDEFRERNSSFPHDNTST